MQRNINVVAARILGIVFLFASSTAWAQGEASAQHFQPAIGAGNFLSIDGARISDQTPFSLGVTLNYASSPYRLACESPLCEGEERLDVVRHMYTTDITGAAMVLPRLQLGLRLPVSHVLGDDAGAGRRVAAALGDPTLEAKFRALGAIDSPVVLGLAAFGSAPLGHAMAEGSFIGHSSFTGGVKAIADFRFGRWALAANVGGIFRETVEIGEEELGSALRYGGAVAYQLGRRVRLVGESVVHQNLGESGGSVVEADAALQFRPSVQPVTITVGGGAGFSEKFGSPVARAIIGLRFDTGTIGRTFGRAPREPEPAVRRVSTDPSEPEERQAEPAAAEGPTTVAAEQAARATAETAQPAPRPASRTEPAESAPAPARPAPPPAARPAEAAPVVASARPAPPPAPAPSRSSEEALQIIVDTRVYFTFNSFDLRPDAYPALDKLARAILERPDIGIIEVAGHADSVGPREANLHISRKRAEVVADYLVSKGVPRSRLVTRGYGAERPVTSNETPSGRAQNRRIELKTQR